MERDADKTLWLSPLVLDRGFGVQFRDDHVHVELGKDFEPEKGHRQELWNVIADACEKHDTRRVLVEGILPEGPRETSDVIDAGQKTATVPHLWLAFAISGFKPSAATELYIVIAGSRGVRVRFFADSDHALAWLRSNTVS